MAGRAEIEQILDHSLSEVLGGKETVEGVLARYPELAEELRPRLEAAMWLERGKGALAPRPGFVSASRARLVAQIKAEQAAATAVPPKTESIWSWLVALGRPAQRRFAFQAALVLLLIVSIVAGSTGLAYAAQDALPGEALYPVKLALEQVELLTTYDLADEIRLHMSFAQNRLYEAQQLLFNGDYGYIPTTLARLERQVTLAVDKLEVLARQDAEKALALALEMQENLANQATILGSIAATIPDQFKPAVAATLNATAGSILILQDVQEQTGGNTAPTATPNEEPSSFGQLTETPVPLPSLTPITPSITPSPTIQASPTASSTLAPSATATKVFPTATIGPSGGGDPEPTSAPTKPPAPTLPPPEPTDPPPPDPTDPPPPDPTKKPLPDPTRRPPKPTENNTKTNK